MAALAFLLAPGQEIPERTDPEWLARCCAWINGTFMAWVGLRRSLPEGERPRREWFDSPNLTVNAADYMGFHRPEHKETYQRYVAQQVAAWQEQGRPDTVVENGAAEFAAATGTASRLGLDRLIAYRGLLQAIPARKLTRGGQHGLLANQGSLFSFKTAHERALLEELTRAYGGDSLSLWTFGHTGQVVLLRAEAEGKPRRFSCSLRLARPADQPRAANVLADLRAALAGSALRPDWSALEPQIAAPRIEVGPWFEAFGLPGAAELVPKDAAAQWDALEAAGASLLRDETPDPALVKRLNAVLGKVGGEKVPARPGKGMARKLFGAAWRLRQAAGVPDEAIRWQQRYAAAASYDDITSSDALDRLTTGSDRQGKGASASLGRLMAYYPEALLRDGWFWSLCALEAESANGHSFVPAMEVLAQSVHQAGFTLVVLPAHRQSAFRQAFGIEGGLAEAEKGWSAEAFVDLPGLLKADVTATAGAWFTKNKASGVVVRCEQDGTAKTLGWKDGKPVDDTVSVLGLAAAGSLAGEARALNPLGALRALGFTELLAPVELPKTRTEIETSPATGLELSETEDWPAEVPSALRDGSVRMLVAVPTADLRYLDEIASDLAEGLKLKARRAGSAVLASTSDRLYTDEAAALLGDLPSGSVWAAADEAHRFRTSL